MRERKRVRYVRTVDREEKEAETRTRTRIYFRELRVEIRWLSANAVARFCQASVHFASDSRLNVVTNQIKAASRVSRLKVLLEITSYLEINTLCKKSVPG